MNVRTRITATNMQPDNMATGRRKGFLFSLRSMNGTANSNRTSNAGMTTVPIHSQDPLNAFSASYRKRKFHSGFGVYELSSGSAGPEIGARTNALKQISPIRITATTSSSLKVWSGQNEPVFSGFLGFQGPTLPNCRNATICATMKKNVKAGRIAT